ncbi:type III-A CRISPR-associated RAMP protein Csm4 [Desulfotomaculum copahuensis]|uniref:CRISPR system Cms protein Csm4 n=1 Tax=Desulfotomaculum copahuensis TaxID=1838280 RepID=A0A1B7LCH0_9FIRM|nr:type III-A CRISPR-associated RAMP protein Csm4 [Desulfotomaculum copahuensis]OAT80408.1 type III-A CRISPR-associated RAMP protein Csm4 [Desulfotomaculum copahuensis]
MERFIVKLRFISPLHLGGAGIGMETAEKFVRSDTLFSALCHALANVYGREDAAEMLAGFGAGKPPFKISSAFPFKGETFFLPRPLVPPVTMQETADMAAHKELNRLSFVSLDVFRPWVRGEAVGMDPLPAMKERLAAAAVYHRVPRVQLDRVSCASGLFHAGLTVFGREAGLYCLLELTDEGWRTGLENAFTWLGESGLGGMRGLGCGRFVPEWGRPGAEWRGLWEPVSGGGAWCLLSLLHPAAPERKMPLREARYEIVTRGGWAASPFVPGQVRRKTCKMFAEGSVLPYQPAGCLVDVTPAGWAGSHPLYRYGYALAVPVEVKTQCAAG